MRSVANNNSATEPFEPILFSKKKHQQFQNKMVPSRGLTYPPDKAYLKMIFLFPRWDMLISWRVILSGISPQNHQKMPNEVRDPAWLFCWVIFREILIKEG